MSPTLTVMGQPWVAIRRTARTRIGMLVLLALPISLFGLAPRLSALQTVAGIALAWLVYGWWLAVGGLLRQNQPRLARLLPGQLRALRTALLLQALGVGAAAFACLSLIAGPRSEWLPLIAAVMLLLAWGLREPLLWLALGVGANWLPPLDGLAASWRAAPLTVQLLLLGAAGLGLLGLLGNGGAWHRRVNARTAIWSSSLRLAREGRPSSAAALGGWAQRLARVFTWPRAVYAAHLLRHARPGNALARLDLGLGVGGQWPIQLWLLALIALALLLAALLPLALGAPSGVPAMLEHGRVGMTAGLFSLISGSLNGRLAALWGRQGEQRLLLLLPGLPSQPALVDQLERRWRREYLAMWSLATVLALALGSVAGERGLQYAAAHAAWCLPLAWLAQAKHRALAGPPGLQAWMMIGVVGVLPALLAQGLGLPVWASLAAGVAVYAGCAARHRPAGQAWLPLGRRPATAAAR